MAKDLEIRITANTSQAIEGMDAFQKSVSGLRREVISSDAALRDTQEGTDAYTKAKNVADEAVARYNKAVEKTIGIMNREGLTVSSLTKNMKLLSKEYDALSYGLKGTDNGAFGALTDAMAKYGDALKDVKDINATLRDDIEKNANSNNLAYYSLIGDKLGYAREQLRQYEDVLRSTISLQGASSEKAKKAAEAYKAQAKEVEKLETASKKANNKVRNLIKSFVSAQAIVYLVQKGFNLLRTAVVDWAAAASKAEETANLFNTTFDQLSVTANRVATEMSTRLGTANSTMQESLGLFADMAAGYGQTQAAALAFAEAAAQTSLDLMSYKNLTGDVTSLMQTFASGLAGNLENFRKMGIIVTQTEINSRLAAKGLDKLSGSALQFAKVQETLAIVQEKSANAMGDMERTLDSTENLNRRVNEANKQLQETLGRGINTILNPLKEAWLSIADAINDATLAQDLFKSGQKNIDVFGFPASKIIAFQKAVGDIGNNFASSYYMTAGNSSFGTARQVVNETNAGIIEQELIRLATTYNATMDDFIAVLGTDIDPALQALLDSVMESVEEDRELEKAIEALRTEVEASKSNATGFLTSLRGISGVTLSTPNGRTYEDIIAGMGDYATTGAAIDSQVASAIDDAISSLANTSWNTFTTTEDVIFGGEDVQMNALQAQADSMRELWVLVNNAIISGQIELEDAQGTLQSIVDDWKDVNAEIEAIEQQKAFEKLMESVEADIQSLTYDMDAMELDDRAKAAADINRQRHETLAGGDYTDEQVKAINESFDRWLAENEKYYDKLNEGLVDDFVASLSASTTPQTTYSYDGFGNNAAAQRAYNEAMQKGMSGWTDLKKLMEENGASIEDITSAYDKVRPLIENAAIQAGTDAGKDDMALAWGDIGDNAMASLGNLGDVISAFTDAASSSAGTWGVIINLLIKLVSQTEVFVALGNSIVDSILPALNSFLKPFLEVIERTIAITSELLYNILDPFYEIIVQICEVTLELYDASEPLFELIGKLFDMLGNLLYPVIAATADLVSTLMSVLAPMFELLDVILVPILNLLTPALDLLTKAFITVYAVVKVVVGFISDSFKWLLGNIVTFFTNIINGVIGALQSVNLFGWKPFAGLKKIDDTEFQKMADTDVFGNVQKNWDSAFSLLDDINRHTMETAENTSEQPDISDLEKVYERGLISAGEFEGLVAEKLGTEYDYSRSVIDRTGDSINQTMNGNVISYGNVTIEISGYSGDAKTLAKEIKRILADDAANPGFDMAV